MAILRRLSRPLIRFPQPAGVQRGPEQESGVPVYDRQVRPFLTRHCLKCHSGEEAEGKLRLDELAPNFADDKSRRRWRAVAERVRKGKMPPKEEPRPDEKDMDALFAWISNQAAAAEGTGGPGGPGGRKTQLDLFSRSVL